MIVEIADRMKHVEEYYFSTKLKEVAAMNSAGERIINLGIGKPDLPPAAVIIKSLHEDSMDAAAHGYQSYKGIPELRNSMASFYKNHFDVQVDPETEVLPLMGSKEGIMHLSMAFLNPGDEVLIPNPGYPSYKGAAKLTGAVITSYDLTKENNYQLDFDQLDALVSEKTKIMWINYPHMPTGAKADPKMLHMLVQWAKENNILIASDAPYSFVLNENRFSILSIPGAKDVCVEFNSLSKSHGMSGWRIGMALGNEEIINAMLRFKSNMDSGMFRPLQVAAISAMGIDNNWYQTNDGVYGLRRKQIWNLLDKIDFQYEKDVAGLFVWSKISDRFQSGEEASDFFLKRCKVFIPPGMIFGSNGEQYVRWSLCQNEGQIDEASRRIISVINF